MTRRKFIQSSLVLSAGAALRHALKANEELMNRHPSTPPAGEFRALRGGVGIYTGRGGTIGFLSAKDGVVVVDTQFPDTAASCLQNLPLLEGRLIDVTINTHHHVDHTGGNVVFKPASKVLVAHENVPKLQFEAAKRADLQEIPPDPAALSVNQVYADTTFSDVWRRDFGRRIVTAEYHGPAHTGGDAVVIFEKANVVHMGDLMFNRMYPLVDRPGGASIAGWIKVLGDCAESYPADALYIFGHGNPKFGVTGTHEDLRVMRDFLSAIMDHVGKQVAAGREKPEVVGMENFPGFPDFHAPLPNRLGLMLGAAFDELTEAKQ
jgi:cyclase